MTDAIVYVCYWGAGGLCMIRVEQSDLLLITMTSSVSLEQIQKYSNTTTHSDMTEKHLEPGSC